MLRDIIRPNRETLESILSPLGIDSDTIERLYESGYNVLYSMLSSRNGECTYLNDTFYGNKMFSGELRIDRLFEDPEMDIPSSIPQYEITNISDLRDILSKERHRRFYDQGMTSFRGQTREYFTKRPFPNPVQNSSKGERLIIPSFWRQFRDDWNSRFSVDEPRSIFSTFIGDELLYYGIKDWRNLGDINSERYGIHTMSDLEDFPDPESKEYGRRWRRVKVEGIARNDTVVVEQHYGFDTCGLDVTFDPLVASYFASHRFCEHSSGDAFYSEVPNKQHEGVIYGFVFRDPKLMKTQDMILDLPQFDHLSPLRPVRQACALPYFGALGMNEAVCDLDFIAYLAPDFDPTGCPDQTSLFPGENLDKFYAAAMEIRTAHEKLPDSYYHKFIRYIESSNAKSESGSQGH